MHKATFLFLLLPFCIAGTALGQSLTFSCSNPTLGAGDLSFDILVTPDGAAVGDSLGDMQVYLDYNTAALGSNIAASSTYMINDVNMNTTTGLYSTNVINNNTTSTISLDVSFDDTRNGIPPFVPPLFPVDLKTGTSVNIMSVTVPVVDPGEMTGLSFNIGLMAGQQFYEPPPPALPVALFGVDPASICDVDGGLPVELAEFSATTNGSSVSLTWSTHSEVQSAGFEVQRIDAFEPAWTAIEFVPAHSTATGGTYQYTVRNSRPGAQSFRLKHIDNDGSFEYSAVVETVVELGRAFALSAWPNPFVAHSSFTVTVAESQNVELTIFDSLGRKVVTLFDEQLSANQPRIENWDATGLSSGLYIYRANGENFSESKTIVLTK